jgi:hypothetical protein
MPIPWSKTDYDLMGLGEFDNTVAIPYTSPAADRHLDANDK